MVGGIDESGLSLREAHRFHYEPRKVSGHLRWDFAALLGGIKEGLRRAPSIAESMGGRLVSVGVDSWGVDYGLLDADYRLIEDPISYRDARTEGVMDEVGARLGREEIFARTGIQFLPFNTLYQLVAHRRDGLPAAAVRLLMIPDLCHHMLCGSISGEHTNASTTQLLGIGDGKWSAVLCDRLGIPAGLLPEVVPAGSSLGTLRPELQSELNLPGFPEPAEGLRVVAPATHDTGSAVIGTPLGAGWAYVSSGTWSLVGVERKMPLVDAATARANFTNEGGAFGTVRLLKNVMGLWLLERCRREWEEAGIGLGLPDLLARVEAVEGFAGFVFPDDPRFLNPPNMASAIRTAMAETRQSPPADPVLLAKVILDSLALRYASVLATIETLTGESVPGIHIVGGGSQNDYLNQATADAAARPVLAGPVEATGLGNVLVQAIGCGEIPSLERGREILRNGVSPRRFEPRRTAAWVDTAVRYREIEACAARSRSLRQDP